jgi:hypothetical protein
MESLRKSSLVFGLFFAGTFVFSIPALPLYAPLLKDAGYILGGGFDTRVASGALLEILLAICNIATAIVIFPLVKRVKETVALAYIAVRIVESVLILTGVICLMSAVTLRMHMPLHGNSDILTMGGQVLIALHDWTFLLGPQFCAGLGNGILLGYLMYKSGLVPPRMALIGLIGGPLAFVGGVLVLFDVLEPMSAGLFALTALEIVWELAITIYSLVKGFRPSALHNGFSPVGDVAIETPARH